jgi:hypothetical protein
MGGLLMRASQMRQDFALIKKASAVFARIVGAYSITVRRR